SVLMGAQAVSWISGFVLLFFLPRYLGSEEFGRLYLAISIATILGWMISFGGPHLIPKEIARLREQAPNILISFFGIRLILWLVVVAGIFVFAVIAGYPRYMKILILVLCIAKLWEEMAYVFRDGFQGIERMEYSSLGVVVEKLWVAIAVITALALGARTITVAIIMVIGAAIKFFIYLRYSSILLSYVPRFNWEKARAVMKSSLPFFLYSSFGVIYYRIDAIMLSMMTSVGVVGWYGGAYRFFDIVMIFPTVFTAVIFPVLSRLTFQKSTDARLVFQKSLKFILFLAIPVAAVLFVHAEHIIQLFYGLDEYAPSVVVLKIFGIGVVFVYVDFILGHTLFAADKQRLFAGVAVVATFLNIGINLVLIPLAQANFGNGGIGAAITTLLTEVFILVMALVLVPKMYFRGYTFATPLKIIINGVILTWFLTLLNSVGLSWILGLGLGMILYVIMLGSTGLVTATEWAYLKKVLPIQQMQNLDIRR
ncbi:MAG TPA: flippase, partial [bacterium]|nr:flippase [bacterium]